MRTTFTSYHFHSPAPTHYLHAIFTSPSHCLHIIFMPPSHHLPIVFTLPSSPSHRFHIIVVPPSHYLHINFAKHHTTFKKRSNRLRIIFILCTSHYLHKTFTPHSHHFHKASTLPSHCRHKTSTLPSHHLLTTFTSPLHRFLWAHLHVMGTLMLISLMLIDWACPPLFICLDKKQSGINTDLIKWCACFEHRSFSLPRYGHIEKKKKKRRRYKGSSNIYTVQHGASFGLSYITKVCCCCFTDGSKWARLRLPNSSIYTSELRAVLLAIRHVDLGLPFTKEVIPDSVRFPVVSSGYTYMNHVNHISYKFTNSVRNWYMLERRLFGLGLWPSRH